MPLVRRIAGIVSANLNDAVDRCEDPEKMLRQAVREMEEAFHRALDRAATAIAQEKLLSRQSRQIFQTAGTWYELAPKAER